MSEEKIRREINNIINTTKDRNLNENDIVAINYLLHESIVPGQSNFGGYPGIQDIFKGGAI